MASDGKKEELIFDAAVRLGSDAERQAYVIEACGGDRQLRANIEALLLAHERECLLDVPVIESETTLDSSPLASLMN